MADNLTLATAIELYLFSLDAAGKRPLTLACYRRDLLQLQAYIGDIQVERFRPGMLAEFLLSDNVRMTATGYDRSLSSIRRIKATLKGFGRWLWEEGLVTDNPARRIVIDRITRTPPQYLNDSEIRAVTKALNTRCGKLLERDCMMLAVFLGTGVRLHELVGLDISDVRLDDKRLRVVAKGNKSSDIFLHSKLRRQLRQYIKRRRGVHVETEALFLSNRGRRISDRQVERRVALWYQWAEITRSGLTVHSLRHTMATRLYQRTQDLVLVGNVLGHRSVETTRIYTHIDGQDLEDAMESL